MKFKTSDKESTDFEKPHIDEGVHIAELTEVKEISPGKFGNRIAFIYKVVDSDVELAYPCYCDKDANPSTNLGKVLLAHGLELGSEIDTDPIIGTKARIYVEDYDVTNDKDEITGTASAIRKVKPLAEKA